MNKRVYVGLFLPAIGLIPLWSACGGQEQPPPAEPSGYQPPTADAGTDQGIGNMSGDVDSPGSTDNSGTPGMGADAGSGTLGPDTSATDATRMGTGGTGGTAGVGGTASGGSGGTANVGTTTRTTGTTGRGGGVGMGTTGGSMR